MRGEIHDELTIEDVQNVSFFTKQGNAVKNQAALSHILFSESTIFDQHEFDVDPNEI